MDKSPVEIWLWLLLVLLPHNARTSEILHTYGGSALNAAKAMRDGECQLSAAEKQRVERTRTREVRALINECERLGIRIITLDDEEYPEKLRDISDPPIVLFVRGSLMPLKTLPALAVVGPRQPSEYGRKVCERLCAEAAGDGVAIISGIAVGIDACAHRCAVNNGGYTAAVLGCGLMVNYPGENEELKETILQSGGALISELLPYASVSQAYFKHRNRIISGLAGAALIVEASSRSGALLTAAHAAKQNRALLCIPPQDIFAERFSGLSQLLSQGAMPVCSICDLYSALIGADGQASTLKRLLPQKEKQWLGGLSTARPVQISKPSKPQEIADAPHREIPDRTQPPAAKATPDISQLSPEEGEVISLIAEGAMTMDELIEKTGIQSDKLCAVILGLEINDVIVRTREGTFLLC